MGTKFVEEEKVTFCKIKRTLKSVECDKCGRDIPAYINTPGSKHDDSKYFRVTTGHNEWGNDSIESVEHQDICPGCINKFVADYLEDGRDSAYIDISTEFVYPEETYLEIKEG